MFLLCWQRSETGDICDGTIMLLLVDPPYAMIFDIEPELHCCRAAASTTELSKKRRKQLTHEEYNKSPIDLELCRDENKQINTDCNTATLASISIDLLYYLSKRGQGLDIKRST